MAKLRAAKQRALRTSPARQTWTRTQGQSQTRTRNRRRSRSLLLAAGGPSVCVGLVCLVTFMTFGLSAPSRSRAFSEPPSTFHPPGPQARLLALGSTRELPAVLQRAFDPGPHFEPVPEPESGDWLSVHRERGQSFEQFRRGKWNKPDRTRNTIYFQPLGDFPASRSPSVETLKQFAQAFFGMKVEVLKPHPVAKDDFTPRHNAFAQTRQRLTGDILAFLKKRLPRRAFCLLGITMEDLYPCPSWNFVFGQASLRGRTGVYSFVRYGPAFPANGPLKPDARARRLLLLRSLRVLTHETGHMFGMRHCIYPGLFTRGEANRRRFVR